MREQLSSSRLVSSISVTTKIAGDLVEAASKPNIINATAHLALTNDIILFTSGVNQGLCSLVQGVATNTISLNAAMPQAPAVLDAFDILRISYSTTGGVPVSQFADEVDPTTAVKFDATTLTGSFATMATPGGDVRILGIENVSDQRICISFDGTNIDAYISPNKSRVWDLKTNNLKVSTVIRGKHDGVIPGAGGLVLIDMFK